MSVRKTTFLALFTTLSLAIFAIESAIPPLVPIPGIKLGLANIITLILLRHFSARDA
ncbi:MAG: Gx transporter family protein, partial [Lachnospiraceae bacterium]|nr:Gx transporter family protein [Lachnospiraceae bacterium]